MRSSSCKFSLSFLRSDNCVLELGHGCSDHVDEIPKHGTSRQLYYDSNHNLVLILRSDVSVADSHDGCDCPVERVDILGDPSLIFNTNVLQPASFRYESGRQIEQ